MTTYKISGTIDDIQGQMEDAIKLHIKNNGIKLPFNCLTYSNREIDSWFRVREGNEIRKYDTKTKVFVKEKTLTEVGL